MSEKREKKGIIRRIFGFAWNHPIVSLLILVIVAAGGLFVTYESMHMTSNPDFCKKCHAEEGTGVLAEHDSWTESIHADYGVECLDCHTIRPGIMGYMHSKVVTGMHDLIYEFLLSEDEKIANLSEFAIPANAAHLVDAKVCLHCHTDEVNMENRNEYAMSALGVKMRALETVVNPQYRTDNFMIDIFKDGVRAGVEPNHSTHFAAGVACASCHIPIAGSPAHSGAYRGEITMATCWSCHEEKRDTAGLNPAANEDCTTCHVTQVALQEGTAAQKYGIDVTPWSMVDLSCDMCHMVEGKTVSVPVREDCLNCHDDGYQDLMDMYQDDFDTQFAAAKDLWLSKLPERTKMTADQQTQFNKYSELLHLLESDGSRGIHNSDYMSSVFAYMEELSEKF